MNKLIFGLSLSIIFYSCFYYTQYSKNKKSCEKNKKNLDINIQHIQHIQHIQDIEILEDNKSDGDIIEDVIDEIINNVIIEIQKNPSDKNDQEKKVSFDDNWITINP